MDLSIGDVVRHRVLGSEKIVVGVESDRYLCVSRDDVLADGRLRPEARVALHHRESLDKIGHHRAVIAIDFGHLYEKKLERAKRLQRREAFKKKMMPYLLLTVTVTPICFILLKGLEGIRSQIESAFFDMLTRQGMEGIEEEKSGKEEEEKGEETREGTSKADVKRKEIERFKKKYLKKDISEEEIKRLKKRYLKTDISKEEIKRLAEKYLQGGMTDQEKEMLKRKYLKPGIDQQDKEMLKRKYLRQ